MWHFRDISVTVQIMFTVKGFIATVTFKKLCWSQGSFTIHSSLLDKWRGRLVRWREDWLTDFLNISGEVASLWDFPVWIFKPFSVLKLDSQWLHLKDLSCFTGFWLDPKPVATMDQPPMDDKMMHRCWNLRESWRFQLPETGKLLKLSCQAEQNMQNWFARNTKCPGCKKSTWS